MTDETRALLDELLTRSTCNTADLLADAAIVLDRMEASAIQVTKMRARLRQAGRTEDEVDLSQKFGALDQKLSVMATAVDVLDKQVRRWMDATRSVDRIGEDIAELAKEKGYRRPK